MRVVIGFLIALSGAILQSPTPGEADEILTQLSKIRLDKKQIYNVRDLTIRRDVLTIALNRGAIAFLEPVAGKVTGAVFIGSGEIVAIPPDAIEKQQVYKFTDTPILNEAFDTAIFRFSDNTYEDIRKEISQHAEEEVSPEDAAQFAPLDASLAGRAAFLNLRLVADLLEPAGKPLFIGELKGEKRGWFNITYDLRATEEISIFQAHEIGTNVVADVWASFNQRSEARNPESVAHENKSPIDILSYEIDGSGPPGNIDAKVTMRIKARIEGARVLRIDLAPTLRVASVLTDTDEPVPYYQYPEAGTLTLVLPHPFLAGQDLTLRFTYSGAVTGQGPWYPSQRQQTIPAVKSNFSLPSDPSSPTLEYLGHQLVLASYHDQWLIEGLARYLAAMSTEVSDPSGTQLRKLLDDARDALKPVEGAGPIWLGQRLASTLTPNGYRAVYGKGVWVIHMLRMMMRQNGADPDAKFLALLQELSETYDGRAVSTWDFKHLAEKHAGKELDWFFDQWVFATGVPSYSVEYSVEGTGNPATIEGKILQKGVPDGFVMPVPVYADGEYLGMVQVSDSEGQFRFRLNKKPERFAIDPEMTILTSTSQ